MFTKECCGIDDLFFGFSIIAALLAALGAIGIDVYLASVHLMFIAAILALWAIYIRARKNK